MIDWKNFFNDFADRYYAVPDFNNKQHVYALQNYLTEQGMLTEDVDYAVKVLLGEAPKKPTNSKIAKQAKDMGLKWKGKGYGPENVNKVTHKVDGDKLVAVDDKKDDDKEKQDKPKEPKANVVSQDAVADRGKDQNTDVNPDYQRDVGEPEKDTENQEKAKIPTKQMKYYEVESQKESKPFDEGGITKEEKSRRARALS